MLIKTPPGWKISENDVTPEEIYVNRRTLLKAAGLSALGLAVTQTVPEAWAKEEIKKLNFKRNDLYKVTDKNRPFTKEELSTHYNNFYEFSLDKGEVSKKVMSWKLETPWKIEVQGLKGPHKTFDVDSITKLAGELEERIYRFRCVEGWSMVVPWLGFPLSDLIKKLEPSPKAKFIKFQTFSDTKIGSNMKNLPYYPWPYTESLTMEEAMNPLSFIATGMYGHDLPKQNGAPIRLVVPWKYGFKSIKSIVKIEFVEQRPVGLWEKLASEEYGFYANVNPHVDHPRWSQATERVLDGKFFPTKIPTLMYNGYEKEVAHLYKGLDLKKNF
ncbi:protein-methionine-sulfoxide reductase catalytic subunit MsrP [Bdellovibrio sp. HCB-110]|uniref:protein-methionine-sulfoxide reductase catalytic subunit MsrP n=1 Tax=Bdellovibrio sp. HCB-110 TaxID=3391182 RepID=UPI0039B4CCE8